MSATLADSRRSFVTVRPHPRGRLPSRDSDSAGAITLVVRDVVAGWWAGVMARRGSGGRRGCARPAWMGEGGALPADGRGSLGGHMNARTAWGIAGGWSRMISV